MRDGSLDLCPICDIGRMRSTGRAADKRETDQPFFRLNDMVQLQCDNPECGHLRNVLGAHGRGNVAKRVRAVAARKPKPKSKKPKAKKLKSKPKKTKKLKR